MQHLHIAIRVFCLCGVTVGILYQLIVTTLGLTLFNHQARGSFIIHNKMMVGSELIGQPYTSDKYFLGRLPDILNGLGTLHAHPSNWSIESKEFLNRTDALKQFTKSKFGSDLPPIDFITGSGSGVDPHISKNAAYFQIENIAKARGVSPVRIKNLVDNFIEYPQFFILGEEKINVLKLNIALDKQFGENKIHDK